MSDLVIGKQIPFTYIEDEFLRVRDFTPIARLRGDRVEAPSKTLPYGTLTIESPILALGSSQSIETALLPIIHRIDFIHAWTIFEDRKLASDEEALVVYHPLFRGLARFISVVMTQLSFYTFPKGSFELVLRYIDSFVPGGAPWTGRPPTPTGQWVPPNRRGQSTWTDFYIAGVRHRTN